MWPGIVPMILVLVWFLALIGGYGFGGWLHLLLPIALIIFLWGPMRRRTE
jgi:Family of unknown function (DUF5670)